MAILKSIILQLQYIKIPHSPFLMRTMRDYVEALKIYLNKIYLNNFGA